MKTNVNRIKQMVLQLNYYRDCYYNKSESKISDYEYDKLYDELQQLEKQTGFILSNSPTQTVGYDVVSELKKVKHSHPMMSLDKTKLVSDIEKFVGDKDCILMCKMDGLTVLLTYEDGELVQAETRGNGEIGELITHNAKVFENIPLHIDLKGHVEFEGEAIITYSDFEKINQSISNESARYKNPRNLVSGSVRQLDSNIAKNRHIQFVCWKVPAGMEHENSMYKRLNNAYNLGFDVVPTVKVGYERGGIKTCIEDNIEELQSQAGKIGYPIDGMVISYDDIQYGQSLGMTGHHPKHSLAYKFYDEEVETILKDIEWTMGKTGVLTPTAIFDPVDIDGTTVERASIHNITIMNKLTGGNPWYRGMKLMVYKANMIIPQVASVVVDYEEINKCDRNDILYIPQQCPICGANTKILKENDSEVLMCVNAQCKGKLLGELCAFVSKNAHDIKGLSEATLKLCIQAGYIKRLDDIFYLRDRRIQLSALPKMGSKKVDNILKAIEDSRSTTLRKFLCGLSIPLIGVTASKDIEKLETQRAKENHCYSVFNMFMDDINNGFDFTCINGFGDAMLESMRTYFKNNMMFARDLAGEFIFDPIDSRNEPEINLLLGMKFCITGVLHTFKNRDEVVDTIERYGGSVVSSVTSKTAYLVNNDLESNSSKNKKAKQLGVPIISENDLLKMIGKI